MSPEITRKIEDPEVTDVLYWIRSTTHNFNTAHKKIYSLAPVNPDYPPPGFVPLYRRIDRNRPSSMRSPWVWGFSANLSCTLGSEVYARALASRFPQVTNMEFVNFYSRTWSGRETHRLLRFSIGDRRFFADSTRGQIVGWHNTVACNDWGKFENYYTTERLDLEAIYRFTQAIARPVGINKITSEGNTFVTDFFQDPYHNRMVVHDDPNERIRASDYLVDCLIDPTNIDRVSEYVDRKV